MIVATLQALLEELLIPERTRFGEWVGNLVVEDLVFVLSSTQCV